MQTTKYRPYESLLAKSIGNVQCRSGVSTNALCMSPRLSFCRAVKAMYAMPVNTLQGHLILQTLEPVEVSHSGACAWIVHGPLHNELIVFRGQFALVPDTPGTTSSRESLKKCIG